MGSSTAHCFTKEETEASRKRKGAKLGISIMCCVLGVVNPLALWRESILTPVHRYGKYSPTTSSSISSSQQFFYIKNLLLGTICTFHFCALTKVPWNFPEAT
jgi:hypothetical protein